MEKRKKILSICIPTYNRRDKLDLCLSFLLEEINQFEEDVEIIISDNCSTDLTEEMVKGKYPQFYKNYYRSQINYGPYQNFYTAVLKAVGKFVWLIGDDDIILPGIINQIITIIKYDDTLKFIMVNDYVWRPESNNQMKYTKNEILSLINTNKVGVSINDFSSRYVSKIIDFVSYRSDAFTPTYSNIMLREYWVETNKLGLESSKKYSQFENLLSCNANSYWIVKKLHNTKGYYFGSPSLLVSLDTGWTDYVCTWFYKILPELYKLELNYGADLNKIKKYKSEWLKYNELIISSIRNNKKNKQSLFNLKLFILEFYNIEGFANVLFKIVKEYIKKYIKFVVNAFKS